MGNIYDMKNVIDEFKPGVLLLTYHMIGWFETYPVTDHLDRKQRAKGTRNIACRVTSDRIYFH